MYLNDVYTTWVPHSGKALPNHWVKPLHLYR